jgi:hypothetical protein
MVGAKDEAIRINKKETLGHLEIGYAESAGRRTECGETATPRRRSVAPEPHLVPRKFIKI